MSILFVSGDLTLISKLSGVAARNQWAFSSTADLSTLTDKLGALPVKVIVLDLSSPGVEPKLLLPQLNAASDPPPPVIAYGPHVHRAKLSAALEAGCDAVFSRGQFDAEMESILAGYVRDQ